MTGPWENYQAQTKASASPWENYKQPEVAPEVAAPDYSDTRSVRQGYGFYDQAMEQGAMLGFGDEATAGVNAAFDTLGQIVHGKSPDIGGAYDRELAARRQQKSDWERAHPVAKYVAPLVGSLGIAAPVKGAAAVAEAVPSVLKTIGQGAKVGAGIGAAEGFGSGEGGLENRASSAATGAAIGGTIGAAAPAVVEGVRGGYQAGKALLGFSSPEEVATNQIGTALARSGRTADEVSDVVTHANNLGVPAVPADTTLPLRRLARSVETIPGKASDAASRLLEERQTGQGSRVAGQIKAAIGNNGDALGTADEIIAQRAEEAKPLYEKAYQANAADMNAPQMWNAGLEKLMARPAMRQAWARAKTIIANEGGDPSILGITGFKVKAGTFGSFGQNSQPILDKVPSMQAWDYMKRGLDDILEKYRNPITGRLTLDEAGRAIQKTKSELLGNLDATNPAYAEARKVFAGHSEMLDALHLGQDVFNGDIDEGAKRFASLSAAEQDMFRIGGVKALRTLIEKSPDGSDIVRRIAGSPDRRARIAMLFKDPAEYQVFNHIMELERETTKTTRMVTGGSPTGRIAAEQSDLMVGAVEDAFHGRGPMGMAMNAARRMLTRAKGVNEETANHIASYLFNPNPKAAQAIDPALVQSIIDATRGRRGAASMAGRVFTAAATNQRTQ